MAPRSAVSRPRWKPRIKTETPPVVVFAVEDGDTCVTLGANPIETGTLLDVPRSTAASWTCVDEPETTEVAAS
jgi:diadenosine tetraphosphate (Ap4A) HIT family hydrolase